jgi:hypothetical protein
MSLQLLATKDSIFQAYKHFEALLQNPSLQSTVFRQRRRIPGQRIYKYLHSQGTMQQLTVNDTSKYNGVSKHLNWTLLEHTHTLLHSSKLPKNLWGEAINHIV